MTDQTKQPPTAPYEPGPANGQGHNKMQPERRSYDTLSEQYRSLDTKLDDLTTIVTNLSEAFHVSLARAAERRKVYVDIGKTIAWIAGLLAALATIAGVVISYKALH